MPRYKKGFFFQQDLNLLSLNSCKTRLTTKKGVITDPHPNSPERYTTDVIE